MSARSLMVLGTASHVGKSILTAALGRILSDEGYRVAPFKAQNMSLNSAATPDGREIGRAQALQAAACRIPARAEMNPILIKPSCDTSSQVVVMGRVWGQSSAADYHQRRVEELFPVVVEAYQALAREHEIILLEGAGSPAEINLKAHDIVNLRMAQAAGAGCLLVGDIDRGGVFASLLGTVELLDPCERELLCGFVVNKFRGDPGLLAPGIEMIARRIQLPCAGVIPHLPDLGLDEEDSVALEERPRARQVWAACQQAPDRPLRVAVIGFPYLANFTDFDALAGEPSVSLAYVDSPEGMSPADLLILPGSKQTLDDLSWLRRRGFEPAIRRFRGGAGILGICGGMQMLGESIEDPDGSENRGVPRREPGLALLPIATVLRPEKVTRMVRGRFCGADTRVCRVETHLDAFCRSPGPDPSERSSQGGSSETPFSFQGYEIHLGETVYHQGAQPFAEILRAGDDATRPDGAVSPDGRVIGTYLHGIFADDHFRHAFLTSARAACGLAPALHFAFVTAERESRIDRLAAHVRAALDMDLIHRALGIQP